jgi:hypothetical protein
LITTGIAPDGAGRAVSFTSAWRAASRASSSTSTNSGFDGSNVSQPDRATHRLIAGLHAGVAGGHHVHSGEDAGDVVLGEQAVGVGDEHPLAAVGVAGRHLHDRGAGSPGRRVHPLQQLDLRRLADGLGVLLHVVHDATVGRRERHRAHPTSARARRGGGRGRRREQAGFGEVGSCARNQWCRPSPHGCRRLGRGH